MPHIYTLHRNKSTLSDNNQRIYLITLLIPTFINLKNRYLHENLVFCWHSRSRSHFIRVPRQYHLIYANLKESWKVASLDPGRRPILGTLFPSDTVSRILRLVS